MDYKELRNIAIIAHVDHGKTTLVDELLKQAGTYSAHEEVIERVMDSGDLEKERGITISAKNTAVMYNDVKINIIDTPGHADFGGEVERTLKMVDGVCLLVDASEGPLPQTRFVMKKALELNLPPILIINKIDRPDSRISEVLDEVYDMLIDLDATDEQLDFPVIYTIAKDGVAKRDLDDDSTTLEPLFDTILSTFKAPENKNDEKLQILVTNIDYDDYVGRIAIGRIFSGTAKHQAQVSFSDKDGNIKKGKIVNLYTYLGLKKSEVKEVYSGDVVAISGIEDVTIGDTIGDAEGLVSLERITVDEPTISMVFTPNTSPFSGKDGKLITTRNIRDRLEKELLYNVSIKVDFSNPEEFRVMGRGELQLSILIEVMRREGFELSVAMPVTITKEIDGAVHEPMEHLVIDVPEEFVGGVTQELGKRKGRMTKMENHGHGRARVEFRIPARGLIGFRSVCLTLTKGTGLMNHLFDGYEPWQGEMTKRKSGVLVADRQGKTTIYALYNLQPRGVLFIGAVVEVYEGMIIGEHSRDNDLDVNAVKEKKLSNVRSSGADEALQLVPPRYMGLEEALEFIKEDELVEVTPHNIRIRKKGLKANERDKPKKQK